MVLGPLYSSVATSQWLRCIFPAYAFNIVVSWMCAAVSHSANMELTRPLRSPIYLLDDDGGFPPHGNQIVPYRA